MRKQQQESQTSCFFVSFVVKKNSWKSSWGHTSKESADWKGLESATHLRKNIGAMYQEKTMRKKENAVGFMQAHGVFEAK